MQSVADLDLAGKPEVTKLSKQLRHAVDSVVGSDAGFAEREAVALAIANEATRQDLEASLQS